MTKIKGWYKHAFNAGKKVQQREHKHEIVDGRAVWNEIETQLLSLKDKDLTDSDGKQLKYNTELRDLYEKMNTIIVKYGMDKSEMCPKHNHFFMQLKNLVADKSNFNIRLNRVAQIGFNAGQLSVFITQGTLCEDRRSDIEELVTKYNMLELDTYIDVDVQNIINTKYMSTVVIPIIKKKKSKSKQTKKTASRKRNRSKTQKKNK